MKVSLLAPGITLKSFISFYYVSCIFPLSYVCEKSYLEKPCLLPHGCGSPIVKPFYGFRKAEVPWHSSALCGRAEQMSLSLKGRMCPRALHGLSWSFNPSVTSADPFPWQCSVRFWYKVKGQRKIIIPQWKFWEDLCTCGIQKNHLASCSLPCFSQSLILTYTLSLGSEINEHYLQLFVSLALFYCANFIAFIKYSLSSSFVDSESSQNMMTFFQLYGEHVSCWRDLSSWFHLSLSTICLVLVKYCFFGQGVYSKLHE